MVTLSHKPVQYLTGILLLASLTACGGSSSSSDSTIPNSVTIFYAHNLAFKNNTTLSTGYNGFGQLGTGDLKSRNSLGKIKGDYRFKGFAMGGVHSIAFNNNSTMSWGYNGFGQLGNDSTKYSSEPVLVKTIRRAKAVAAGAYHSLALLSDDTLWSWGKNDAGQLGVATNTQLDNPEQKDPGYRVKPVQVKAGGATFSNISSIAANAYHSLARANGFVWAWGFNGSGQLAIDPKTTGALASPSVVAGLPQGGIDGIASGGAFNYALARNGTVWAWGNNDNGQLGNNSKVASYTPVQVKKKDADGISNLDRVVQVAAGIQHGLALLSDGTVWAWGYNAFSQLGNNSNDDSLVAVQVVMKDTSSSTVPLDGVTEIRAFGSSSMARIGKDWYVWGDNAFGQLGVGTNSKITLPEKMLGL